MIIKLNFKSTFVLTSCAFAAGTFIPAAYGQAAKATSSDTPRQTLDYAVFKERVEPIFLKRRSQDYARCYACHEKTRHKSFGLTLEKLEPGKTAFTEEQSKKNFQVVSRLVVPGNPAMSVLLMHPLAPEAGGDAVRVHSGGRQFPNMQDPDWRTIAEWIRGKKSAADAAPAVSASASAPHSSQSVDGKAAFEQCELCHNVNSTERKMGPSLKGLFKKATLLNGKKMTEENVRAFVKSGSTTMPAYAELLSEAELSAIINYLKTL